MKEGNSDAGCFDANRYKQDTFSSKSVCVSSTTPSLMKIGDDNKNTEFKIFFLCHGQRDDMTSFPAKKLLKN